MYKEFWQLFIKGYGGLSAGVSICAITVAVSLLEGLNVGLLIPLLENLTSTNEDGGHWVTQGVANLFEALGVPFGLNTILLALAILVLGTSGLRYLRLIMMERTSVDFTAWIRSKSMLSILFGDIEYFHRQKVGILADNLTTQSARAGSTVVQFTELAAAFGILFVYFITAFLVAPVMAAVALGTAMAVSLGMQYYISKTATVAAALVNRENELQSAGMENLGGIHVIKSFSLEALRSADFSYKSKSVGEGLFTIGRYRSQMTILQEMALFAIIGTIVFVGASVLNVGIAVIVALLFILYRAMPRVASMNTRRTQLVTALASMHSVKSAMDETSSPKIVNGGTPFAGLHNCIELKDVRFSYNPSSAVLKDTTFTIEKGKMTAIVGASGAGKTTLIDLILRFYDPVEGAILVDGVDLRELDLPSWRGSIGVVSQDIFLFNDTVAYNIGLGQPEFSMEDIINAARGAYAHEFIGQLPQGYETRIGDRGWNLSGGQRQRLALARAILRNPQILILDEATSSLDSESERLIQQYMNEIRGACTMIVVAHRLSTIQSADKIVVLQDGTIFEEGTWESLIAEDGLFAAYYKLQSGVINHINGSIDVAPLGQEDSQLASGTLPRTDEN